MKLPIINSIVFGELRPKIYLKVEEISGEEVAKPCSLSEIWKHFDERTIAPLGYGGIDENGNHYYRPIDRPNEEDEVDYLTLANAFAHFPSSLSELENYCIKHLSPYVSFDFERERPINISSIATASYTPVFEYHFPADFPFQASTLPQFPIYRFYDNIVKAEMTRIKLALLEYTKTAQSDVLTINQVSDTLKDILQYALNIIEDPDDVLIFSFDELHEFDETNGNQLKFKYSVFPIILKHLIKTYFEIEILFRFVLKRNVEQDFDDVFFKCMNQYPSKPAKIELQTVILVQEAQHYIAANNIEALHHYHPQLANFYHVNTKNPVFLDVLKAAENAIFLTDNTNISQLIDDKFCKAKFQENRKALEKRILALKNPRQIQSILEDELDELDLFADSNITIQSIPRMLRAWITKQLEVNEHHLGSSYEPVTETPPHNSSIKELPSSVEYATNVLEEKYNRFVTAVRIYRFEELKKVSCLDSNQKSQLIHLIVEKPAAYAVVMLIHIGYFDLLKKEYSMNKTKMFQHVAKAIGSDERSVKGYFNVLDPKLHEDKATYNSEYYVEPVKKDYDAIARK
ncbi:MAG: hypothetical protein K6F96_02335 [Bacteroidales bacterium]|nr:hypothetical protein [Bacteroidales bacterium]